MKEIGMHIIKELWEVLTWDAKFYGFVLRKRELPPQIGGIRKEFLEQVSVVAQGMDREILG